MDQAAEGVSLTGPANVDKITEKIRTLIVKVVTPILKSTRSQPDNPDEYKTDFGSIGPYLYQSVLRSRGSSAMSANVGRTPTQGTAARPVATATTPTAGTSQQRLYVVNNASGMVVNQAGQPKILVQQPLTPGMANMFQPDQQQQPNQ